VLDAGSLLRPLNELSNRYLLTVSESDTGRQYRQHAIVQAFYYQMPGRKYLREMHRLAAEFYETEQPEALKAGMHYERAGEIDKAAEILSADVWALINQGHSRLLKELLARISSSALAPLLQAQVRIASGHVQALFGEGGNARQSFQSALEGLNGQEKDPQTSVLKAQACRGMAELLEFEDQSEALAWVQRGLQYAEDQFPLEQAALLIRAGMIYINLGNPEDSQKSLEQGLERLPQGPSQLRSQALSQLGSLHFFQGDLERAKACALEALEISRALHDHFQVASILSNLSTYRYTEGDWQGAIADFNQALELAERLGSQKLKVALEVNLGTAYINTGEADLAREHLEQALELARTNAFPLIEIVALFGLAELGVRRKDWQDALHLLQEAECLALANEGKGYLMEIYTIQAQAMLGKGLLKDALEKAELSVDMARNLGEPINLGAALRVHGQVLFAQGQVNAAISDFERSFQLLDGQDPYEAARTQAQWAYALERVSKGGEGKALLAKARATFRELGAKNDLDGLTPAEG
jgi:tetratricopeptide (TPR) repeat protein